MATMVAADLGAQSGRVAIGRFDGSRLDVTTVHRFPNVPVRVSGVLRWDVLSLFDGVLHGLRIAAREAGRVDSVGVDSWAVDFGLIDGKAIPVEHGEGRQGRGAGRLEAAHVDLVAGDGIHRSSGLTKEAGPRDPRPWRPWTGWRGTARRRSSPC